MNPVPQTVLTDPMVPVAIWMMLMVAAVPAVMLLASPQAVHRPGRLVMTIVNVLRCHLEAREQARRDAAAAIRYAAQARVAAAHADEAVRYRQELWREAGQRADDLWLTWQATEKQVTRGRATTVFTAPWAARTSTEVTDRARFLHRTVRAAVERGDLPATALAAALSGRDGWDPWRHPVEQELVILQAIAAHQQQRHQLATVAERAARHDIHHAAAVRDRLRDEARTAAQHAARHQLRPAIEHWSLPALRLTWGYRLA
ncbi:hypothetical protein [Actinoplanes sp. L3-i22]|uniref:hypothetical protein n=1 Tax=Actinoplanes sp. L3-i22 TaxID=2836373 RepID=UPI001C79774F|nr:hypothetical protein [Actinoplanes sp. L3-i22]BCY05419.1 hypothetical protein L3i22_005070 [Actinoplanes sp. L3-i22]